MIPVLSYLSWVFKRKRILLYKNYYYSIQDFFLKIIFLISFQNIIFSFKKTLLPEYNFGALLISLKQKLVFCKFLVLVLFHIIWYLKIFEVSPKDHLMLETSEKEMSEKDAFSAWKKLWCLRLIFLPSWSVWSHKLFFEKIWYKLY